MKFKSLKTIKNLDKKTVLLRLDLDVAVKAGRVEEDERLRDSLETINYILEKKGKIIIIGHLGRPKRKSQKYSLEPVAKHLKKLLGKPIEFIDQTIGKKVERAVKKMKPGQIIILENLRFNKGELENDSDFAKELASLADVYVNDAFGTCHRRQASMSAIKDFLPATGGLQLKKEIEALDKALTPKKPLVIVMGGAKLKTKIPLIEKLYSKANQILLGGGLANTFFKYHKKEIGQSLYDSDSLKVLPSFFQKGKLKSKIFLPIDVVVKNKEGRAVLKNIDNIKKTDNILDIGPQTIEEYAQYIKKAQTLIFNGPMGKFEEDSFKHGTMAIVRLVASRATGPAYGVIGGGDIVKALKVSKMQEHMDWVSNGGGAMLTYLAGQEMPGLDKIIKK